MKFCCIKDLDIPWFVGMIERIDHLTHVIAYDDIYVWLLDIKNEDHCISKVWRTRK